VLDERETTGKLTAFETNAVTYCDAGRNATRRDATRRDATLRYATRRAAFCGLRPRSTTSRKIRTIFFTVYTLRALDERFVFSGYAGANASRYDCHPRRHRHHRRRVLSLLFLLFIYFVALILTPLYPEREISRINREKEKERGGKGEKERAGRRKRKGKRERDSERIRGG